MSSRLSYFHPARFTTIPYQLFFLCITVMILSLMVYKPFVEFRPVGAEPIIKPLTPAVLATWGKKPIIIKTGLHITDLLRFDTVKNEFIIDALIWFDHTHDVSKEIIDAFSFTKGEFLKKSPPITKQLGAITRTMYAIRLQFSTMLDFSRFPIDDHRIFFNLINYQKSAYELAYEVAQNDFTISQDVYVSGWTVLNHSVKNGYADIPLSDTESLPQSKVIFSIEFSKGDIRQLSLILLPLLFLFYLGLFAFSIKDIYVSTSLPLTSISGLFAYSFVIQFIAPMVGYIMISDYIFLFFLGSLLIMFPISLLGGIPEAHLSRKTLKTIEGITIVTLQVGLILVWYILLDVR